MLSITGDQLDEDSLKELLANNDLGHVVFSLSYIDVDEQGDTYDSESKEYGNTEDYKSLLNITFYRDARTKETQVQAHYAEARSVPPCLKNILVNGIVTEVDF